MSGRFEYYKDETGAFRFRLLGANGEVILTSDAYKSKLGCTKGIESVRANSSNPDNFVKDLSPQGGHSFKLISLNGRVIGNSRTFATAADYSSAIVAVARLARGATVDDRT